MRIVIIPGGGDQGSVLLTDGGAQALQPFEPAVRFSLRSAAAMVTALEAARTEGARQKMARQAVNLCNLAVEQVEDVVGQLDAERSLVFQGDDGGFVCGSSGKPPIPLPWPPHQQPSVAEMISSGAVDSSMITLLQTARGRGVPLTEVFETPDTVAANLGVELSEKGLNELRAFAPSQLAEVPAGTDREILQLFHSVIEDGRFLDTWTVRPYEVAQILNVEISDAALERLAVGDGTASLSGIDPQDRSAIAAGIIWAGVCIAVGIIAADGPKSAKPAVIDRSGVPKL